MIFHVWKLCKALKAQKPKYFLVYNSRSQSKIDSVQRFKKAGKFGSCYRRICIKIVKIKIISMFKCVAFKKKSAAFILQKTRFCQIPLLQNPWIFNKIFWVKDYMFIILLWESDVRLLPFYRQSSWYK